MTLDFSNEFKAELCCATGYYGANDIDLGRRFVETVETAVREIKEAPLRWRLMDGRVRRCLVRGFPYCIYFMVGDEWLFIGALLHTSRHPDTWKRRFENL